MPVSGSHMDDSIYQHPIKSRATSLKVSKGMNQLMETDFRRPFARTLSLPEYNKLPHQPSRRFDDPNTSHLDLCRVKSFRSTRRGLVRKEDSCRQKNGKMFMSTGSVQCYRKYELFGRSESQESTDSVGGSSVAESYYRVQVLGSSGVGKKTLIHQLLSLEGNDKGLYSCEKIEESKAVSVFLDDEESLMEFADTSEFDDHCPAELQHYDAYVVVFSLTDPISFKDAGHLVQYLRESIGTDREIILVGNKVDLVRQRRVSCSDGCLLATKYDCKYTETAAELGHKTNELLVGLLRQIRIKLSPSGQPSVEKEKVGKSNWTGKKFQKWKKISILFKFLNKDKHTSTTDSCQYFII